MSDSADQISKTAVSQTLALPVAEQLQQLLVLEFDALKEQDLDRFENLQSAKADLRWLAEFTIGPCFARTRWLAPQDDGY